MRQANDTEVRRLDVTVVLLDDGFTSTAVMPIEVFHAAGLLWPALQGQNPAPRFNVTTASIDGRPIRSPYGIAVAPETSIDQIKRTDIVVVPSSGLQIDEKMLANSALVPWLRRQYEAGAILAGVCVGAAYLAEAGLLDGRVATTHWALAAQLERRYPQVLWRPEMMVTEEARLLCSGGVTAAADASLYLVEKLCGHQVALECARSLLLGMPRVNQSGYAVLPLSPDHDDEGVRRAETLLQTRCRENLTIEALADLVGMSPRTLARRFKAATGRLPGAYLQAVRIELAKAMLERDGKPIQSVSAEVGYEDAAFFRALFKRSTGMTPAEYRARFAMPALRGAV